MSTAVHSAIQGYANIDELLGDGRQRFFSHGYKNSNPQLRGLRVSHTLAESALTAQATLGVSGEWSTKGTSEQTPHLATTDVMVLACKIAEALLASRYSPELLATAYVESMAISGGQEPVEDSLRNLAASGTLHAHESGRSSVLRCKVASMAAEVRIVHSAAELGLASVTSPSEEALVGGGPSRLYGELWTSRQVTLESVTVDSVVGSTTSAVSCTEIPSPEIRRGLEAAYPDALSPLEYFVATLQLGQVLIYQLDGMSRADSNTLWMRKTRITAGQPRPSGRTSQLSVQLRKSRLVEKAGEVWRCADVVGSFADAEVICSVAHRLPWPDTEQQRSGTQGDGQ